MHGVRLTRKAMHDVWDKSRFLLFTGLIVAFFPSVAIGCHTDDVLVQYKWVHVGKQARVKSLESESVKTFFTHKKMFLFIPCPGPACPLAFPYPINYVRSRYSFIIKPHNQCALPGS